MISLILGLILYGCAYLHFRWEYKFFAWLSLVVGTVDILKGLTKIIGGM